MGRLKASFLLNGGTFLRSHALIDHGAVLRFDLRWRMRKRLAVLCLVMHHRSFGLRRGWSSGLRLHGSWYSVLVRSSCVFAFSEYQLRLRTTADLAAGRCRTGTIGQITEVRVEAGPRPAVNVEFWPAVDVEFRRGGHIGMPLFSIVIRSNNFPGRLFGGVRQRRARLVFLWWLWLRQVTRARSRSSRLLRVRLRQETYGGNIVAAPPQ
mmetsp:Transcript_29138/g.86232  ORF Transcript_29138/g.86232 Transcript_29138/m.86232 type:complete len:209 (-) Transcript_29138:1981-2607(-)